MDRGFDSRNSCYYFRVVESCVNSEYGRVCCTMGTAHGRLKLEVEASVGCT